MSVILYEDEKFLRIAESLKLRAKEVAHIWGYPKGWDSGAMTRKVEKFSNCIRNSNIDAWNERYDDENIPFKVLVFSNNYAPYTLIELIKSLNAVSYNSVESEKFNRTKDRLRDVIYFLMHEVVSAMPEYESAETW